MKAKEESPFFIEFWEKVWKPRARHTDGRGLARDAFAKQVRDGASPQDIVDGARYFFRSMKDKDREFVPLSSTWLNRGAFEDLAILERAYQARIGADNSNVAQASPREIYLAQERRRAERSWS
jgi:hypothetical protein